MRFGSVCSGIEAASVSWQPLGWKAQWFSEIEPFPCALLKHHYPATPNLGDMTKFESWPTDDQHAIDLLCGGTPCQSFSVAGLRAGLDDPRGNLMLTFGAIAAKYRPQWLVWENVPGVLSSNGGRDFGTFLGMLGQLGYGFAYRVLDAQYFGVAQRRRRVFVVGYFGDWRRAAAVLFERHSLQGHPAPGREAGKVAPTIPSRSTAGGGLGTDFDLDGGLIADMAVAGTLESSMGRSRGAGISPGTLCVATGQAGAEIGAEIAPTLNCNHESPYVVGPLMANSHPGSYSGQDAYTGHLIAHSLRGEGFDASEDGTGRGTPLVPVIAPTMDGRAGRSGANSFATSGGLVPVVVPTLVSNGDAHSGFRDEHGLIAFDTTQITSAANYSNPQPGDPCRPLAALAHVPAIAIQGTLVNRSDTAGPAGSGIGEDGISFTLTKNDQHAVQSAMQVRRLTPRECERLQGFPDDYTAVPNRGKPAADGPRYKALGNSWAVPNVRWIGERIEAVALINSASAAMNTVAELETA